LAEIKKENEKRKKDEFVSKARMFEQKKGPTDEEKKLIIQKAAAKRKFERQLQKNLKSNENMNPMALEFQLKRNQEGAGPPASTNQNFNQSHQSDWELVEQIGAPSYYWNRSTNETSYELPGTEQSTVPKNEQRSTSNEETTKVFVEEVSSPSSADDQGWLSCQNENGSRYFWNYHTNETVFTLPAHLDPNTIPLYTPEAFETPEEVSSEKELSQEARVQAEADRKNWTTEWDERYQAHYYRNHVTETLQWDPPLCLVTSPAQPEVPIDVPVVAEHTLSPEGKTSALTLVNEQTQEASEQPTDAYDSSECQPIQVSEPTETIETFQGDASETCEPNVTNEPLLPQAIEPLAIESLLTETNELVSTASQDSIPSRNFPDAIKSVDAPPEQPPGAQHQPPATVSPLLRSSSASAPPPPPPPPRRPKVESNPLPPTEPQPNSPKAETPSPEVVPSIEVAPVDQTSPAPKEEPPTTSPLVEPLEIQDSIPELELKEEQDRDGHGDDDVLVGDGSKPVGCTSCSIS
jgi:hypothetical protein